MMTDRELPPADFDALAPETFDSARDLYRDLRSHCPVARSDAWNGFWALMRYEDVAQAAANFTDFTTTVQNVVPKVAFTGRRPPLHFDPPEHTPYRRVLDRLLGPKFIAKFEPEMRLTARRLLAPLLAAGRGDVCLDYASHLPVIVFGEWMNLDKAQRERLAVTGRAFNLAVQDAHDDIVKQTSLELYDLARDLIKDRRQNPRDRALDPTSAFLAARHEDQPLPDELILGTIRQVLVVGIVAPMVVFGSICVHLSRHPDLQQTLRTNPQMVPDAVEEFLRLYTPYRGFARTARRDVTIQGRRICPGEPIALVYASANRDESVFPNPDDFILNRPNLSDHLAFGKGPHACAGSALARLEQIVMLQELLAATRAIEIDGPIRPTRFPEIGTLSAPMRLLV